jgi:putative membrane protein
MCAISGTADGLFVLILNAFLLILTSGVAQWLGISFHVTGFVPVLIGGIVIGIVAVLNIFVGEKKEKEQHER